MDWIPVYGITVQYYFTSSILKPLIKYGNTECFKDGVLIDEITAAVNVINSIQPHWYHKSRLREKTM